MEPQIEPQVPAEKNQLTVPMAIVVAGVIIAIGIYFSGRGGNQVNEPIKKAETKITIEVKAPSTEDHLLGNPNAKLTLIEFSDTECPFCKTFHPTVQKVVDKYGKTGDVSWIYRHFPLDQIHPKARKEAEATECVAELGGNQKFWDYLGAIFTNTPANNGLDPKVLTTLAVAQGIDKTAFQTCLDSGKYASRVEANYQDGLKAGVQGTPFTVIIAQKPFSNRTVSTALALYEKYRDPQTGELPVKVSTDMLKMSISGAIPHAIFEQTVTILLGK